MTTLRYDTDGVGGPGDQVLIVRNPIGSSGIQEREYETSRLGEERWAVAEATFEHEPQTIALMFPNPPGPGESYSFTRLRNPRNTTKKFGRKASGLSFADLRLHDLRGTHETHLLDKGMSVAAVAARCGHDPATMLRSYAKRARKADAAIADIIGSLSSGALRS